MDQTRGIDRSKPIGDQIIEILDKRYYIDDIVLGGRFQVHKKVAMAILSLTSDYFYNHKDELKPYVDD
jgi:hypothetical protein